MSTVIDQHITGRYAVYNGDCMAVLPSLPDGSVHFSVYSPPFATGDGGLYHYSSDLRDFSNSSGYEEFFARYGYLMAEMSRVTMPGRMTAVHCMDVPTGNTGTDALIDFPGDIIRLHGEHGFAYVARYCIWKEPLGVRNRTLQKNLAHRTIVDDSTEASNAGADYLLVFRRKGTNPEPVTHPNGFTEYHGATKPPAELNRYRGWTGDQKENRYSHWIWRRYASSLWDDIDIGDVLPYLESRDEEDEKHVHPLQLQVIARAIAMFSNEGDTVLTPFMGVSSEVYQAVRMRRRGIGMELKPSYYRQALRNLDSIDTDAQQAADTLELFDGMELGEVVT